MLERTASRPRRTVRHPGGIAVAVEIRAARGRSHGSPRPEPRAPRRGGGIRAPRAHAARVVPEPREADRARTGSPRKTTRPGRAAVPRPWTRRSLSMSPGLRPTWRSSEERREDTSMLAFARSEVEGAKNRARPARTRPARRSPSRGGERSSRGARVRRTRVRRRLLEKGREVVAVSRHQRSNESRPGLIQVAADVADEGWQRWCGGCSAAIHLVGIIREVPRPGRHVRPRARLRSNGCLRLPRRKGSEDSPHVGGLRTARPPRRVPQNQVSRPRRPCGSGLESDDPPPSLIFDPGDGFTSALPSPWSSAFPSSRCRKRRVRDATVAMARWRAASWPPSTTRPRSGRPGAWRSQALAFDEVLRRIPAPSACAHARARPARHRPLHRLGAPALPRRADHPRPAHDAPRGIHLQHDGRGPTVGAPRARFEGPTWLRPA